MREEVYDNGFAAGEGHALYSGTKSFWGPLAIRAEHDGILRLDEPVAETIVEWQRDPDARKRGITARMLLTLTAGFGFGGLGMSVPLYDAAIATPLKNEPGTTFTYGGIPLQIFGAFLDRKLAAHNMNAHDYLRERLLRPAGVEIVKWRSLKDGTRSFPTGAFLTARAWLAYGSYIAAHHEEFSAAFRGTSANSRYGLGWWLGVKGAPADAVYASGSGGQGLYVIPSLDLVAVHFGKSASYKHPAFLRALLTL